MTLKLDVVPDLVIDTYRLTAILREEMTARLRDAPDVLLEEMRAYHRLYVRACTLELQARKHGTQRNGQAASTRQAIRQVREQARADRGPGDP